MDFAAEKTFTVESTALAGLLHMCGEQCVWSANQYDADRLREKNNRASVLHAAGVRGKVGYGFKSTPRAMAIMKAWEEQGERIKAGLSVEIALDDWTAATLCACYIDTLNKLSQFWKTGASNILARTGEKSFSIVSTNASRETLAHCQ